MRPGTILWFEALYGASLMLLAIMCAFSWKYWLADFGPVLATTVLAVTLLLPLILAPLMSRRRSRVAKWLLVLLLIPSFASYIPVLLYGMIPPISIEQILIWALQGTAIILLFTPSARAWLAAPRPDPRSAETLGRTFE